jgi:hypothetical protein
MDPLHGSLAYQRVSLLARVAGSTPYHSSPTLVFAGFSTPGFSPQFSFQDIKQVRADFAKNKEDVVAMMVHVVTSVKLEVTPHPHPFLLFSHVFLLHPSSLS